MTLQRAIQKMMYPQGIDAITFDEHERSLYERRFDNLSNYLVLTQELSLAHTWVDSLETEYRASTGFIYNIKHDSFRNQTRLENPNSRYEHWVIDTAYCFLKQYKHYHHQLKCRIKILNRKLPFIEDLIEKANHPKRLQYKFSICDDMDYVFDNM